MLSLCGSWGWSQDFVCARQAFYQHNCTLSPCLFSFWWSRAWIHHGPQWRAWRSASVCSIGQIFKSQPSNPSLGLCSGQPSSQSYLWASATSHQFSTPKIFATSEIPVFTLYTHVWVCVKATGQLLGVWSLFLPCGFRGSNSGCQVANITPPWAIFPAQLCVLLMLTVFYLFLSFLQWQHELKRAER